MSRIGKQFIPLANGITVEVAGQQVTVKGPKGVLTHTLHPDIAYEMREGGVAVVRARESKKSSALWGLERALLANMVNGVMIGFEKKLQFQGIGFRASIDGGALVMMLGFTHPVKVSPPSGIVFKVEKDTITISGINRDLVGQVAASIRAIKPPEPYKGKGIRYINEIVRRKSGKKAVSTS